MGCLSSEVEEKRGNQHKPSQHNTPCYILIKTLGLQYLCTFKFNHAAGGCVINHHILGAAGLQNPRLCIEHQKLIAQDTSLVGVTPGGSILTLHPQGVSEATTVIQLPC